MELWRSLAGMVEVELTSADPSGALQAINARNVTVYNVERVGDLTLLFSIRRKNYRRLRKIAKSRGDELRLYKQKGLYWSFRSLLARPVLLIGVAAILFLTLFLPTKILFVQVEGNVTVPSQRIIEAASDCGIGFGALRRDMRSEKIKNALLSRIPELQWAGVNTYGCVAVISVREKTESEERKDEAGISSIIASSDGVISEMTVTAGNPVCKVGDEVKAGQILVSGYTDCGICIRGIRAEAEIYAQTLRNLTAITPSEYTHKTKILSTEKKISLIIGKKRINFYKGSGISDTSCVKMYSEKYLTLPGGFRLPVALAVEEWVCCDTTAATKDEIAAEEMLEDYSINYLTAQMNAGRITNSSHSFLTADGVCFLEGEYACLEMIGKTRLEETLENYGEAD